MQIARKTGLGVGVVGVVFVVVGLFGGSAWIVWAFSKRALHVQSRDSFFRFGNHAARAFVKLAA
jgi:hypothetical protein